MTPLRRGPLKDSSGTITSGGTSQVAMIGKINCIYFLIQNPSSNTITLWLNFDAPATAGAGSIELVPGSWYENPPELAPTSAIHILGATTAQPFTIKYATG